MAGNDHSDSKLSEEVTADSLLRDLAAAPSQPVDETRPAKRVEGAAPVRRALGPGRRIANRFEIIEPLGRGGFGSVFLARDLELGRHVALKVLSLREGRGPTIDELRLFDKEAKATALLNHPNIVTMYDWGTHDGRPYLVLERLIGEVLSERIERGRVHVSEAIPIAVQVVRALCHAHATGLLHLDLKPHNIWCGQDGLVKVLDLGLAKLNLDRASLTSALRDAPLELRQALAMSLTGGTAAYMAPEQWRGGRLDERTDLWAVGVTLFEMLAGELPFRPSRALEEVLGSEPAPSVGDRVADLPADLVRIVSKALTKPVEGRFQTAGQMLEALLALDRVQVAPRPEKDQPYRYLEAFTEADSDWFFGREREVERLRGMLDNRPLVALVGPSGAGKTSLVRAGLIPRLRRDAFHWQVVSVRPGADPLRALQSRIVEELGSIEAPSFFEKPSLAGQILRAEARDPGDRILLFVDQFEELYGQVESADERERFAAALLLAGDDPHGPVRVVLSIRADFLAHLSEVPALRDQVASNILILGPPDAEAMADGLRGPARSLGFDFEEDLASEICESLKAEAAPLPLLQLTASRLWEKRDRERRVVSRGALDAIGGVAGVIAAHADEVLLQIADKDDQHIAREIFLQLVTAERTRRSRDRAELIHSVEDVAASARVLEHLLGGRLLTTSKQDPQGWVELAHESLIDGWDRLRGWLEEARESLRQREKLSRAAAQWVEEERSRELLWTGRRLREELGHQRRSGAQTKLGPDEAAFLVASRAHQRSRRWRRWGAAALGACVVAAGILLSLRGMEVVGEKERQAAEAVRVARANAVVNAAAAAEDPLVGALLLVELAGEPEPPAGVSLARRLAGMVLPTSVMWGYTASYYGVAFSPDGSHFAFTAQDTAQIWRTHGSGPPTVLRGHRGTVITVAVSPDGSRVATGGQDGTVRIWRTDGSGNPIVLRGHKDFVGKVAFTRDGARVLSHSGDHTVRVWRADGATDPLIFGDGKKRISGAVFTPDRTRIAIAYEDGTVHAWRLDDPRRPLVLASGGTKLQDIYVSPDGSLIAGPGFDGTVRIWRTDGSAPPVVLRGHKALVYTAAFSSDSKRVVTASRDGQVRIWRSDGSGSSLVLRGHRGPVLQAVFGPSSAHVFSGSRDHTGRIWQSDGSDDPVVLRGHGAAINNAIFSPDGSRVLTASYDRSVRIWRTGGSVEPKVLKGHSRALTSVAFSHDGSRILTASEDGTARIWRSDGSGKPVVLRGYDPGTNRTRVIFSPDATRVAMPSVNGTVRIWRSSGTGEPIVLRGHTNEVLSIAFSPDGTRVVTASADRTARIWGADGSRPSLVLRGHRGVVFSAAFSPDGTRVVTGSADQTARIWRTDAAGAPVILRGHRGMVISTVFSPDGSRVATGSVDRTARIWRADGSGEPLVLRGHEHYVFAAFSPDGSHVVTWSTDGTVRIWPSGGAGDPTVRRGHKGPFVSASFSADSELLLTCGEEGTSRVRRIDGSSEPIVLEGRGTGLSGCALSPDGTRVLTASHDGRARIWRLWLNDWPGLLKFLRRATNACLSVEQRKRYLGETAAQARVAHEACERRYNRVPVPTPPASASP